MAPPWPLNWPGCQTWLPNELQFLLIIQDFCTPMLGSNVDFCFEMVGDRFVHQCEMIPGVNMVFVSTHQLDMISLKGRVPNIWNYCWLWKAPTFYHAGLFQLDISTEMCTCCSSRCTLQWTSQQPVMTEQCFSFLNTLPWADKPVSISDYVYIEKRCSFICDNWSRPCHGKVQAQGQ